MKRDWFEIEVLVCGVIDDCGMVELEWVHGVWFDWFWIW